MLMVSSRRPVICGIIGAKVTVMIRPRGDFVSSRAIMLEDIKCARDLGVDGFALGDFNNR